MSKQTLKLGSGFIIPVRVLAEDDDTLTIQVPKRDDYSFKVDKDKTKNRFLTIVFLHSIAGHMSAWKPWEGE